MLETTEKRAAACTLCALAKNRKSVVFGEGNETSKILFLGEAPGAEEDLLGRPFVGRSGGFLNEELERISLKRKNIYITNLVKCRPPNNRNPKSSEIKTCSLYLEKQIKTIKPEILVTLGNFALHSVISSSASITEMHGQKQKITFFGIDLILFPMFHPAAALRKPAWKKIFQDDMTNLQKIIK